MFIINAIATVLRWRRYRRSLRALALLDDRTLHDIGLTRSALPNAAWSASR